MADVKVESQNLMHGNAGITDGIYAILSDQDRRERIRGLGSETSASSTRRLDRDFDELDSTDFDELSRVELVEVSRVAR